ncbi:MAG: hypothetical protein C0167_00950 [Nitrososphaera sp.]|nr:MAG: hypothetical protein C0167_00950 [Nitrososphaera sp.]
MSAPQGSGGGSQQTYYPNPAYYLGQMVSDPASPSVGQWWYRIDAGQIRMYTQNGIVTLQYQSTEIIASDTTIGGTNVNVTTRLVVLPGVTLTIYGSITFNQDVVVFGTLQSSNPSASSSSSATNSYDLRETLYLDGTYSIAQYNTDQINYLGGLSFVQTIGSISISGTLTFNFNFTLSTAFNFSGSGTLAVNSGYTLTIGVNVTFSVSTVSGSGTLSISSGYTLTQGAAVTISISTITVAGTWANAGYGITIPSGATVSWNVSGSITTASTAGTLTVNGTCYWIGAGVSGSNSATTQNQMSFVLSLVGSGIFIGAPAGKGTATNTISLSSTSIAANSASSTTTTSTGKSIYFALTQVSGSAVGKYTIGGEDATSSWYLEIVLIYIGTANTTYTVNGYFGGTIHIASGDKAAVYNMSGSAGTITLTGTFYA